MQLRVYQKECLAAIENKDSGAYLVSMATGLGKTVVFSHIKRRGRVLVLSHREELVYQPVKYYDCPCGIEKAQERSHGEEVVLASVQTLIKRLDDFKRDDFDIIITDEAHHAAAPSYKKIYAHFTPRLHVGFTATPNRGDKLRLDDVFEQIIFERDLRWGIAEGYLTDIKCLRVRVSYDLTAVRRRMGDFVEKDLDAAVNTQVFNKEVAEAYRKFAVGQTLIFASSVAHAENIAANIEGAVVVSQKTENRKRIIEDFKQKKIKCIVNCMIFTEGTDLPMIETIIVARPTQNASLYAQMVGRGLRKYEGKRYLTLIDLVGVSRLDICTAPSLLGLDAGDLPERRKDYLDGTMLTKMESEIEKLSDCPENWVMNVERVKMFAAGLGASAHDVNWTKKPNGWLVYQFSCGDRIGVKAVDEVGKTFVARYVYDEEEGKFIFSKSEEMSLQQALDRAYMIFKTEYADEERLWNLTYYYRWSEEPATEKQIEYLKSVLGKEFDDLSNSRRLSKGDCTQIINAVKIKTSTPRQLAEAAKRRKAEVERLSLERAVRSSMKITHIFINKGKKFRKFYAIILVDQLVITDDWGEAQAIITAAKDKGEAVRFKGFLTLNDATEYLRS